MNLYKTIKSYICLLKRGKFFTCLFFYLSKIAKNNKYSYLKKSYPLKIAKNNE